MARVFPAVLGFPHERRRKTKPKPAAKSRILLVDDHASVLNGYRLMIDAEPDLAVCATATSVPEALAAVERAWPDLVVTDLTMAGRGGIDLIKDLLALHPDLRILVCSMHDEMLYAERALRAGAKGYVMKDADGPTFLRCHPPRARRADLHERKTRRPRARRLCRRAAARERVAALEKLSDREFESIPPFRRGKDGKGNRRAAQPQPEDGLSAS